MLRNILGAIVIMGFVGIGMVLGFTLRHQQSSGSVLGATENTPFWIQKTLLLGGNDHHTLLAWDGNTDPTPVKDFSGRSVITAAISPDFRTAIVVLQENGKNIFWQYEEGKSPTVLATVDGTVFHVRFASTGRFLAFQQQRSSGPSELDVLDLQKRLVNRVAPAAQDFSWLPDAHAIVSFTADGTVLYHEVQLDGTFFSAQTLLTAKSTVGVLDDGRRLLFVAVADSGTQLVTYDLVTKEQRLVAPLTDLTLSDQNLVALSVAPGADHALLFLPKEPGQDPVVADVDLRAGTVVITQTQAHTASWISAQQALLEATVDGDSGVANFSLQSHNARILSASVPVTLLP